MQKQFFLSPDQFRQGVSQICDEREHATPDPRTGPRIMISGCPMAAGNTKVPDIIEQKGGVIVVEESGTGTRSFWDLVDEDKDPWTALAERYLEIPCACMTPNDQRIARIVDLQNSTMSRVWCITPCSFAMPTISNASGYKKP